jgi:hypothetical protein
MKISDHLVGIFALAASAGILIHGLIGIATGGYEFSPGTFTYDSRDAGVSPFSEPANAKTENAQ